MYRATCFTSLAFVVSLFFGGCGDTWKADYSNIKLVEVSGRVTLDGKPLADATVAFEAADRSSSTGRTNKDGSYRLMFDSDRSGVTPGPKVVRITTAAAAGDGESAPVEDASGKVAKLTEKLSDAYNTKSQLQVTIEGSRTCNFDLKSDGSTKGPS